MNLKIIDFKNRKQITTEENHMNQSFKETLKKGNVDLVKDLLKEIGDINLKDRDKNTPSDTCLQMEQFESSGVAVGTKWSGSGDKR
ncbi:hypothetical protein V6Z64_14545 [Leptospira borgpetersenii]|nr:hypothetical protein [Leptospira borgpetersenii]MCH1890954.1 hypothetical protein [Leptospira borgpetersenii]MCH1897493.1 hypothetical protein [Leptospira borgpetersenii]UOY18488.1 hypothetical protein K8O67_15540 [Leptospira borgpetersenii]UOZ22164.1 hypothetical protein K8O65_15605 [Leptospira borgpetersenii]UOZ25119.1 hypothetical protein K8O64_15605 [Leptospira borgpetersenii]